MIIATVLHIILPLAVGFIAGFIGTLLGIGGGAIIVPLLIMAGFDPRVVVPASLIAILGTSIGGLRFLLRKKLVDYRLAFILELASISGALFGSEVFFRIERKMLVALLGLVLIASGILFVFREKRMKKGVEYKGQSSKKRMALALLVSFTAGMISAMLGIGGGVLKVPMLVLVLGLPIRIAVATSKLMVGITAATGVIGHALHENIDLLISALLAVGTYSGALSSSRLLVKLRSPLLYLIASLYYLFMGFYLIAKILM